MVVSKKDWSLFRERLPEWQEHYMERLTREYITLLSVESERASDRFWALYGRIRNDRRSPGVRLEMRKSSMIYDLVHLLADEVICTDDLKDFSEDTQEFVRYLCESRLQSGDS